VREWLVAGMPEVVVAVADVQSAGRGRQERSWQAPAGRGLLLSAGFRPAGLAAGHAWRLGAIVGLAMLAAAEEVAGLPDGLIWLKWPNDLVALDVAEGVVKLGGVLGETTLDARGNVATAVVGIGINVDWPATEFPAALAGTMTSLRELTGAAIEREVLLEAFLARLGPAYDALRVGGFDAAGWSARQVTTGRLIEVAVGEEPFEGRAVGVAPESGALRVETGAGLVREIDSGEVTRCRVL
jgi:BirA family biotin operon repressor/biotin-[acetyl-CoA-carboxylase] ligase